MQSTSSIFSILRLSSFLGIFEEYPRHQVSFETTSKVLYIISHMCISGCHMSIQNKDITIEIDVLRF